MKNPLVIHYRAVFRMTACSILLMTYFHVSPCCAATAKGLHHNIVEAKSILNNSGTWVASRYNDSVFLYLNFEENGKEWLSYKSYGFSKFIKSANEKFSIVNDAGQIDFRGNLKGNGNTGQFTFTINQQLTKTLRNHNIINLQSHSNLALIVQNIQLKQIDSLSNSFARPLTETDLVNFFSVGINSQYLSFLKQNGCGNFTTKQVITAKVSHVNERLFSQFPVPKPSYNQVIAKSTDKIREYKSSLLSIKNPLGGLKKFIPSHAILPINAVDIPADFLTDLHTINQVPGTEEELTGYITNGVTASYISELTHIGFIGIPPLKFIALKALGVDRNYVQAFRKVGYVDLSADDCFVLKSILINASYAKEFPLAGYTRPIPVNALFLFKLYHVTPLYAAGLSKGVNSTDMDWTSIIVCKMGGVTPEFIDSAKKAGAVYSDIQDYISLKKKSSK